MKRVLITAILLLSLLCIGLAEDGFLRFVIGEIDWFYYGISWITTIVVLLLGIVLFSRVEKTFMDTV